MAYEASTHDASRTPRTAATPKLPIRSTVAAAIPYDLEDDPGAIRLHANECSQRWPPALAGRLAEVAATLDLCRYPDPSGARLRGLIAERKACSADRVILGNGSDELIALSLLALGGPGSVATIPTPTFSVYGHFARLTGWNVREVPLDPDFELDAEAMNCALFGAAVCFLARPNNPTSSLWDADLIRWLVVEHPSTVFVLDEAYAAFSPGCSLYRSDAPANVVHLETFSKVGLAALRIGFAICDPVLAQALNTVRMPYNVSSLTLAAAEMVMQEFEGVSASMVEEMVQCRRRLVEILGRVRGTRVYPAHGSMVLTDFGSLESVNTMLAQLRRHSILVRSFPVRSRLQNCIRFSVGSDAELDALEVALDLSL